MSTVVYKPFERLTGYLVAVIELDVDALDRPLLDKYDDAYIDIGGVFNQTFLPQRLVKVKDHLIIKQAFKTSYPLITAAECPEHEKAALYWRDEIRQRLETLLAALRARASVECADPVAPSLLYAARYWGILSQSYFPLAAETIESGNFDLTAIPTTAKTVYYNCTGGARFWYAFPAHWGKLELYGNTVSNLLFTGWSDNITPGAYADPVDEGFTVDITDINGFAVTYRVYMSAPVQNGSNIKVVFGDLVAGSGYTPTTPGIEFTVGGIEVIIGGNPVVI